MDDGDGDLDGIGFTPEEAEVSAVLLDLWATFAWTGAPTGPGAAVPWAPVTPDTHQVRARRAASRPPVPGHRHEPGDGGEPGVRGADGGVAGGLHRAPGAALPPLPPQGDAWRPPAL
jgi:hypothetical protein